MDYDTMSATSFVEKIEASMMRFPSFKSVGIVTHHRDGHEVGWWVRWSSRRIRSFVVAAAVLVTDVPPRFLFHPRTYTNLRQGEVRLLKSVDGGSLDLRAFVDASSEVLKMFETIEIIRLLASKVRG